MKSGRTFAIDINSQIVKIKPNPNHIVIYQAYTIIMVDCLHYALYEWWRILRISHNSRLTTMAEPHQDFILGLADTRQTLRTPKIPTKSDWIKLPFYQSYLFCLLQKLLVFAVYQKLADSVGHCFFCYRCWRLGLTCTELPAENLTLYCLPYHHLS